MADIDIRNDDKDEIELMDIFIILWKKKLFIISGMLICMIFAAIVSFSLPKIYQVQMKIRPGYETFGVGYQKGLAYIKGKIDANVYDETIMKELSASGLKGIPGDIDFKVSIPKNSDILDIILNVSNVESGKKILQNLYSLLAKDDDIVMKNIMDDHGQAIRLEKIKLDENNSLVKSKLFELEIIEQSIKFLDARSADANTNNEILINEQKKLLALSGKNDEDSLAALLYTNTIQQNLLMINSLMNQKINNLQKKQAIKKEIDLLGIKSKKINETILKSENLKNQIKKMVMLMPPKTGEYPIKPQTTQIVILAGFAGLFLMVVAAFLHEYVSNYQEEQKLDSL